MEGTRDRILEGLIRVINSDGVGELSVPAVATEAGVSVPTIYRHFGSKQALVEALGGYVVARSGLMWSETESPETVDEVVEIITEMYRRGEAMDPALRAAMATDVGQRSRRMQMPRRLAAIENLVRSVAGPMSPEEFTNLRNIVLLLGSSAALRAFKDYLNMDAERAAATVGWAIRRILETQKATS